MVLKAACLQIHADFHENFENVKVKYFEVNKKKLMFTLQMALKILVKYQKEVKICKNSPYCFSY
jgi:succinylglutamate desuccinylase